MTFDILGIGVPSSLFNAYNPAVPTRTIVYGFSQFGWNFPSTGLAVFSKTRSDLLHGMYAALPACYIDLSVSAGMTLNTQLQLRGAHLSYLGL